MKINSERAIETEAREQRRKVRVNLACFILVRPFEPAPEYFESIILTENSSKDGLSFETENGLYCQRMRLLVTFPYSRHPSAINRDYIAEVLRRETIADGRYRVAVRFLTTAKLSIPQVSKLSSSNVWNALWQRARIDTAARKVHQPGEVSVDRDFRNLLPAAD